jgi:hypothetical protein
MHEGHRKNTSGPYGRMSQWLGSQHGHVAVDVGVALVLMAIVLAQSWARHGSLTRWRVHSAAHLLERDLRLTRQTALAASGNGSQAELCLRSNGYDVYTIAHQARAGQSTQGPGIKIKSATAGQEYARGIEITADATATYTCTADVSRRAFVYLASGAPKFPDSTTHRVVVALSGQTLNVTIQPGTGTANVSP